MTASRKVFLALALLALGFGTARFMGEPAARWYASQTGVTTVVAKHPVFAPPLKNGPTEIVPAVSDVRLIPDFGAKNPYAPRPSDSAAAAAVPPVLPQQDFGSCEQLLASNAASGTASTSPQAVRPDHVAPGARVKLRDEAPRPLTFEPPPLAAINSAPRPATAFAPPPRQSQGVQTEAPQLAPVPSYDRTANSLAPANFVQESTSPATITASYSQPQPLTAGPALTAAPGFSPPPWLENAADNEPRRHVIKDGDSLERLAGRYLDDPRRSNEIYEANRELLASPELLPIGVELTIPNRGTSPGVNGSPQSSVLSNTAMRSASHQVLVPVRPIPSGATVVPRAQLRPPTAVE